MDEALSRLVPTYKIGNDGLSWWVGQIEQTASDTQGKGGWRYKVAIVGEHPKSKTLVQTKQLPWATVMMPVTAPFMPGNIGGASAQLIPGCWVIGFYLDNDKTKPIIMGSIGQVPGATTVKNEVSSDDPDSRFKTGKRIEAEFAVNPDKDGDDSKKITADLVGVMTDGTSNEEGARVDVGKKLEEITQEDWCVTTAKKCKERKLKEKMNNVIGEMLFQIQNNNGNIGTYYVDKYTGGLYSSTGKARTYVNKAIQIIRDFLAGVKGYITKLIGDAVDSLVKAIVRPNESGNVLTPVTTWFNKILKDLGCKMEDLGLRLAEWLTNLLMSYLNQIYRNAICHVDEFVNGIISKIYQLMNELLQSILGPLQDILGAIAAPFNMIGKAINYVLQLLGISCTGVDTSCEDAKKVCTDGAKEGNGDDKDFLDKLLEKVDNLFGDTPADYTQYVCEEAYTGKPLEITTVGFAGGVPKIGTTDVSRPKIVYDINDVEVKEGDVAQFTVTRSGSTATIETTGPHGYDVGDEIEVSGVSSTGYVGFYNIIAVTDDTINITVSGTPTTPAVFTAGIAKVSSSSPFDGATRDSTLSTHFDIPIQVEVLSGFASLRENRYGLGATKKTATRYMWSRDAVSDTSGVQSDLVYSYPGVTRRKVPETATDNVTAGGAGVYNSTMGYTTIQIGEHDMGHQMTLDQFGGVPINHIIRSGRVVDTNFDDDFDFIIMEDGSYHTWEEETPINTHMIPTESNKLWNVPPPSYIRGVDISTGEYISFDENAKPPSFDDNTAPPSFDATSGT